MIDDVNSGPLGDGPGALQNASEMYTHCAKTLCVIVFLCLLLMDEPAILWLIQMQEVPFRVRMRHSRL